MKVQLKYYKQTNGDTMGGPLSVVFSEICMTKLFKRSVDDIFTRRKTNVSDQLLELLNNYRSNIKLTCEINPKEVLDTKIC